MASRRKQKLKSVCRYRPGNAGAIPAILKFLPGNRTMTAARVRAIISAYVEERLLADMKDDADLSDLKVDPLDRLGIACALDEEFLIEISDDDEEGWKTVGDVLETIQRLATERPAVNC